MADSGGPVGPVADPFDRQWTHRQALQIIEQLPDNTAAAIAVLDRAKALLEMWQIGWNKPSEPPDIRVFQRPKLVGGE